MKNMKNNGVTRTWRVYGADGHRQRESFNESYRYDFSNEYEGVRIIEVRNSDKTGTNDYSEVIITRNTASECSEEFWGQVSDGIFENSRVGQIVEIIPERKFHGLKAACSKAKTVYDGGDKWVDVYYSLNEDKVYSEILPTGKFSENYDRADMIWCGTFEEPMTMRETQEWIEEAIWEVWG